MIRANQAIGDELVMLQPAATLEDLNAISPEELVDQFLANELDALITTFVSPEAFQRLNSEGLPVICLAELDYHHPLFTGNGSLRQGGEIAGQFIAQRLGGKGHAVCVTAGLENNLITGQTRLAGLCESLKAYPGISLDHIPAYWSTARLTLLSWSPSTITPAGSMQSLAFRIRSCWLRGMPGVSWGLSTIIRWWLA